MQNLKSYLKEAGLTQDEFAKRISDRRGETVHQGTIAKLCGGKRPSWSLAKSIEDETDGSVPVSVWASDIEESKSGDDVSQVQGVGQR